MTALTKKDLQETLEAVMNKHRAIDNETHALHHEFIAMQAEKYHTRVEMWRKFRMSAIGSLAVGIMAALAWVGKIIFEVWHSNGAPHP